MNKEGKNVYRLFPCRRLSRLQKIRRREKRLFLPHLRGLYLRGLRKEKQRRLSPLFFAAGKIQLILPGPLPRPVFFNSSDFVFAREKNRKKELAKPSPPTANRKEKPPSPRGQGKTSYPLYSQNADENLYQAPIPQRQRHTEKDTKSAKTLGIHKNRSERNAVGTARAVSPSSDKRRKAGGFPYASLS